MSILETAQKDAEYGFTEGNCALCKRQIGDHAFNCPIMDCCGRDAADCECCPRHGNVACDCVDDDVMECCGGLLLDDLTLLHQIDCRRCVVCGEMKCGEECDGNWDIVDGVWSFLGNRNDDDVCEDCGVEGCACEDYTYEQSMSRQGRLYSLRTSDCECEDWPCCGHSRGGRWMSEDGMMDDNNNDY